MKSRRSTAVAAVALAGVLGLSACSSGSNSGEQAPASTQESQTASPQASLKQLNKDQLVGALVELDALPKGFAVDETSTDPGKISYLCDYDKKVNLPEHNQYAGRDFVKGTGLQADLVRSSIRQYDSVETSTAFFNALEEALKTCKETTQNGDTGKVSVVSADSVGDKSVMVKIDMEQLSMYTQYVLVGPSFVQVAEASMLGVSPDTTVQVAEKQVAKYQEAARG